MSQKIIENIEYDIRYSTVADESHLRGWLIDPLTRIWYPPSSEEDVFGFARNWIGFSRYQASLTATYIGKPIGVATIYLMPYKKVAHLGMLYMVVEPEFQRNGVGTSLIRNIIHLAKTKFRLESLHSEVFDGSAMEPFLHSCGFEEVVRQDNFVKLDNEFKARIVLEIQI